MIAMILIGVFLAYTFRNNLTEIVDWGERNFGEVGFVLIIIILAMKFGFIDSSGWF